jgi:glycosyltransferase involved in cell wall biosynthesis
MAIKPTVTIAIPAYNEEANIGHLLDDLTRQNTRNFTLAKIIVNSDGSTDLTNNIVKSKNLHNVLLLEHDKTQGVAVRQNEMLDLTDSDILVILNADIVIADPDFTDKIISPIINEECDLVSVPLVENKPTTYFEKVVAFGMEVKNTIFHKLNNGNNVYTCHGTARALSKKLYAQLRFTDSEGEDAYSYFYCITKGFKYRYVTSTAISYRVADNFKDYRKQNLRFHKSKELLSRIFGKEVVKEAYHLPNSLVFQESFNKVAGHPILAFVYLLSYMASSIGYRTNSTPPSWDTASSSKIVRKNA